MKIVTARDVALAPLQAEGAVEQILEDTGTVTIRFTLVGEPKVGGLLEQVEIVDTDTTISQQTIRDCFVQQLYALELDPPPDGVTVAREIHLKVP